MQCFKPLIAYRAGNGEVVFQDNLARHGDTQELKLPCGQCHGCRQRRAHDWAIRCMHEKQLHELNAYVTLTYADEHLPENGNLQHRDFQLFMKRLRKKFKGADIRYYMCGEYGDENKRPHFHAILFGIDFPDKTKFKIKGARQEENKRGQISSESIIQHSEPYTLYNSQVLEKLWGKGGCKIGAVTYQSAAYVARYIHQKITGQKATEHYTDTNPETGEIHLKQSEYNRMSTRPAIGKRWIEKFHTDVYPHGKVVFDGTETTAPRYYDKQFRKRDRKEALLLADDRKQAAALKAGDNTDARLKVKEQIALAKHSQLKRKL